MLQPRIAFYFFIFVCFVTGDVIDSSPRRRRQNDNDVTTVLLVNNQGPSTFGRFLSVKPDLGLITSTARTFIQEGVTTQYATQVLGTTLDNGRLYAHLLAKSSRVLYDNDKNTRSDYDIANKQWKVDHNLINSQNFIKNIDFVSPNKPEPYLVFPTTKIEYKFVEKEKSEKEDDELLKSSPSDNARVPYVDDIWSNDREDRKIFHITQKQNEINHENVINHKEFDDAAVKQKNIQDALEISKVRERDTLPTFTVRNEFSPSGLSFLGDLPHFDSTERSKSTTSTERKAKLLFLSGKSPSDLKKLPTVTYTGFADFTTVVGDTVIVFSPHTSNAPKYDVGKATSISVEATIQQTQIPSSSSIQKLQRPSIRSTSTSLPVRTSSTSKSSVNVKPTVRLPQLSLKPSFTIRRSKPSTKVYMSQEFDGENDGMHTVVIDATDRHRETTTEEIQEHEDMEAKSAVLAHEQKMPAFEQFPTPQIDKPSTTVLDDTFVSPFAIEPSESQIPMLSTPSEEDIAKILASLQSAQSKVATEPLEPSTSSVDVYQPSILNAEELPTAGTGGATTIFFDDDFILDNTATFGNPIQKPEETSTATTTTETVTEEIEDEEEEEDEHPGSTTAKQEDITTQKEDITTMEVTPPEPDRNETKTDVTCTEGIQIVPTTVYKTLTYLTTFFIPKDETSTTTSIKSNEVVSTEIGFETQVCTISASQTVTKAEEFVTTTEEEQTTVQEEGTQPTTTEQETTEPGILHDTTAETKPIETTPLEITTEKRHVTESEPETTEMTTENGEEIEVLFKTLYTTYTYLTTFFQDTTSSIVSRKEVITNVITSTLEPGSEITDPAVAGLLKRDDELYKSKPPSFDDIVDITPTNVGVGRPTVSYPLSDQDIRENVLDQDLVKATPSLTDTNIAQLASGVKTYYTTYTYFTTIFVDGETEISSRTEVYTNYVTQTQQHAVEPTILLTTADKSEDDDLDADESGEIDDGDNFSFIPEDTTKKYSTMIRGNDNGNEYETISTMVTDVRSSTSSGERRIIDSVDNRNVLEDQMVAESNNDSDILPSPTLLLQTSYTTFTYFTTMYQGTTASNVVSRLETITNVITETLAPTNSLSLEDLSLPITYFTTFTYWTTLYKDGVTRVTSREETISNVVSPTVTTSVSLPSISVTSIEITHSNTAEKESVVPTQVATEKDDLTTYYTTYTYYTTSYVGDSTVINSRLDTVTNVINETREIEANQVARAIGTIPQNQIESEVKPTSSLLPTGLLSTIASTINNSGTQTVLSTDIYGTYIDGVYAKVLESTTSILTDSISPSIVQSTILPTGVVSLNRGKIVDAQGISTLYYTTQAIGTYIDNLYAQVIESTSSINVDEDKKSLNAAEEQTKHRTGLVRLIEGSIVQNRTTTFYQSKVIGTIIEGRYAQIIESTSSFIIDKTPEPSILPTRNIDISPTATQVADDKILPTNNVPVTPSHVVIESSLADVTKVDEETTTEGEDLDEGEEDEDQENSQIPENGRKRSRLTFQTRKRTFKPAFRPFSSRVRPTFAPKRNKLGPSGATTITRSDFTPTVTAVPASKTGGRFSGRKSFTSASSNLVVQATASGTRRFVRPKSSSISSSILPSSSFTPRGRSSSIKATPAISGSRRYNSKTSNQLRSSSLYVSTNRFARIRPTPISSLSRGSTKIQTTPSNEINDAENDLTTQITENPTEYTDETQETTLTVATTTELSRRIQNPLLKFRKPLSRPTSPPKVTSVSKLNTKTSNKVTTSTIKPKTTRPIPVLQNRQRPGLLPRRGLFTTTTTPVPEDEEDDDEEEFEDEEGEEDTDYEGSNKNTQTERPPASTASPKQSKPIVSLRPFKFRQRSKRETNYSRLRRPPFLRPSTTPKDEEPATEEPVPTKPSRFKPRSRSNSAVTTSPKSETKRISPTRSSVSQSRSQFTLREKDKSSANGRNGYRRGNTQSLSIRRTTTASSRAKIPKLRIQHTTEHTNRRKITDTGRSSGRNGRRGTTTFRSRNSAELNDNHVLSKINDGTITVTHSIPTEATIPVVNGRITEYRNIITAKYSTEVLIPQQYSTAVNSLGKVFTVLRSDSTNVGGNGVTEITRYVLNETPTTTVVFTPTYIRGYKTSWSHILPSTAYGVEQVVTTVQPALAAQAPLANILLSQLLLGNPGFQQNPLLGLQNLAQTPTPTTEFKTRSTTYVTTVTSAMSTVIPITFRGKEILTTIVDSTVNVVTATELITDTIVVTPTITGPGNLNSLLLPLLLQQQQQQVSQQPAGVFGLNPEQVFPDIDNKYDFLNFDDKSTSESEEFTEQNLTEDVTRPPRRKNSRKKPKTVKNITPATPPKETSIVTLYVSGKTPGEFSTILSTVTESDGMQRRKREISVKPSGIKEELRTYSYIDSFVSPASDEIESYFENQASTFKTESLESVLGDVSKHIVTQTPELFKIKPTKFNKPKKYSTDDNTKESSINFLVETSLLVKRGETRPLIQNQNVSNMFGKITPTYRYKRENSLPNRRIVKKLVRVKPIYKNTYELDSSSEIAEPARKHRKRVVVRKKKLLTTTPRPRRKMVITKKRLLKPSDPSILKLTPKTSVISSVEYDTSTVVQTRLRTYTFVVTRVNGDEHIVTSTTEIKPQTKTITVTEARTVLTTLTLFDSQQTTVIDSTPSETAFEEEPRYNLATRVMSNGVEVIVAGDKTTLPGEPDIKRILPTTIYKPITLKPSTLSDHMMMVVPYESSNIAIPSLHSNQFVTKTCLTTFTYLTTYLENGTTTISSHEQVVSNVATEERNSQGSASTSSTGIILTQQPILEAGTFQTTYTYLNTILDGEQPIVVTSRHIVTNTVTAPGDYLSHLKSPQEASALRDTNTYYSTAYLTKTLREGDRFHVTSTKEIVTQVVITESVPYEATPTMNLYITLDHDTNSASKFLTTDVVKTYFVTYTYYNSLIENGEHTVKLNVSTSTDIVTEKVFLQPKRPSETHSHTSKEKKKNKVDIQIFATKTYVTTYTYFTTILQVDKEKLTSTIVSSNTREVENVVTETINPNSLDSLYVSSLKSDIKKGTETVVKHATLLNGDKLQITAINKKKIVPTKVLPIEKTKMVTNSTTPVIDSTNPNVITGSTIIFFDEEELVDATQATPALSTSKVSETAIKNNLGLLLSTEIVKKKSTTQTKRHALPTSLPLQTTTKSKFTTAPPKKKTNGKIPKPTEIPDLLGLGSINTFQVLKPVINAMAGLIKTNIKNSNRNDTFVTAASTPTDIQNHSPIYIPIGDQVADVEIAESQNLATIHINEWESNNEKPSQESPLMNGGIPISPGQVITANSDVIVGKPGRIGPRIPSIPLTESHSTIWSKPGTKLHKEEYMGPPPAPLRPQNVIVGEKRPPNRQGTHIQIGTPIQEFKLLPEPLFLPEVIERSTGQPLLVNLQPSQIAFINIPFNRTTALLYGGSTELHKNGKYFDDPAPHPVPEFSVLKQLTTQRAPTFVSPNQKQVMGYIRVDGETINNNPILPIPGPAQITPSKPTKEIPSSVAPPLSFEMVHNGGDFTAHIIKHDDVMLQPPPPPHHTRKNSPTKNLLPNTADEFLGTTIRHQPFKHRVRQKVGIYNSSSMHDQENESIVYLENPESTLFVKKMILPALNPIKAASKNQISNLKSRIPGTNELKEYLTPPKAFQARPSFHRQRIPIHYDLPQPMLQNSIPSRIEDFDDKDFHKEDDLANEDGEVVQESISRPLRPGQIPQEVLEKFYKNLSTPNLHNVNFGIKVVDDDDGSYMTRPLIQVPRPFEHTEVNVRLENQLTNQIDVVGHDADGSTLSDDVTSKKNVATAYTATSMATTDNKQMYVTSLPINLQSTTHSNMTVLNLQTEKPFYFPTEKPLTFPIKNLSRFHVNVTTLAPIPISLESEMEVMKPPPLPKPHQNIQPPKVTFKSANKSKQEPKPPVLDLEVQASIQSSIIPSKTLDKKVVGLRPPPLNYAPTTKKVLDYRPNVTTYRPTFSLEINPPRPIHPYTFEIPPSKVITTKGQRITRRPPVKVSTQAVLPSYIEKVTPSSTRVARPTTINFVSTSTMKKNISTQESLSSTLKYDKKVLKETIETKNATTIPPTSTSPFLLIPKANTVNSTNNRDIATSSITAKPTYITKSLMTSQIMPNKYLTHTETTTVTITRTTVTEVPGGPPSTMTILVTTTEKVTKIDTVTEIHTLLQPTSIIETITTTINQAPPVHYSNTAPSTIHFTPTIESSTSSVLSITEEDDLEEFIIRDTDPPPLKPDSNGTTNTFKDDDSILVVMTDKKNGKIVNIPDQQETDLRDEVPNNDVNHILLGGILIDSPPILDTQDYGDRDKCHPECKANKNELCQKFNGLMRCVCRPGFARMFLDHPCKPTYTYSIKLVLDRNGKGKLRFNESLSDKNSTEFHRLARLTYEGLDRMVMQSDLRDVYHGVQVHGYEPFISDDGLFNEFHLQLSENTEQQQLEDVFKKYLTGNNYSLGGTDLYASKNYLESLVVADFDECKYAKYHDCSDHAHCFNMAGTYTCSCKEGFSDLSENPIYPGRICSAELVGCERCHYHGTCYSRGDEQVLCECFQWYSGEYCHVNLKVLLIALGTLGALLLILLVACIVLTCCRKKSHHPPHVSFMPQRLAVPVVRRGTLDRRLMNNDTNSESSQSDIPTFVEQKPKQQKKVTMKKSKEKLPNQNDRSLPVVIPRAKYHPVQPACVSMVPIEKRKSSATSSNETKLLSYLDVGPNPNKNDPRRKPSNTHNESYADKGKISGGALVSAGFEVSATVGCGTLCTIATTCGTEADRSENATLIQKISATDILSSTGSQSQFTTFRKSLLDDNEDSLSNWLDLAPKITTTVSEARSYDETTIHVPTKSYRNEYEHKTPSHQHNNDEANTMAERDVGSTFLLPHTHLYKHDRGSDDASGFDSL
ncbi:hypothetical protein RI129_009258 [Pyrocoelia pectoralis]|uniref:Uncharacterized protein n=1 Tax=Pyrocoelia pectoralis TaxID=417401 RepID=A0AAN7V911_9COLE